MAQNLYAKVIINSVRKAAFFRINIFMVGKTVFLASLIQKKCLTLHNLMVYSPSVPAFKGIFLRKGLPLLVVALLSVWLLGCGRHERSEVDRLNDLSYACHYRSLDSTEHYALQAKQLATHDDGGRAEATNNQAFVAIMRMDYPLARRLCDSVYRMTDNQIELLVSDIQRMRICQRESRNKDFYDCYQQAGQRLRRITESEKELTPRQQKRMVYARSEYFIVASTYYYYVGLERESEFAIKNVRDVAGIEQDTAQYISYLYSLGSGGIVTKGTQADNSQREFDYLMRAYRLAVQSRSLFWTANTLQALSEHLLKSPVRNGLIADNPRDIRLINTDQVPDSLLAGNLAERSLQLFQRYGDVYQIAGGYRTLASCYWQIRDYASALDCLHEALGHDTIVGRAPDLVASIREQLCLAYSAIDDKQKSDYNRNIYLDLQEQTRQDRYLEARADQLRRTSRVLNLMLAAVVLMILLVVGLLVLFAFLRNRSGGKDTVDGLLASLAEWRERELERDKQQKERYEEACEALEVCRNHVIGQKQRNVEQRAKVSLVNSLMPLIDRMILEVERLVRGGESKQVRAERYEYLAELVGQINVTNNMLTEWIQLRRGSLFLHVGTFPLHPLFDLVSKGEAAFRLKGVRLCVEPTTAWVKADRVLTLFMLNTLMDNARKFTTEGCVVTLSAKECDDYVELSVADTGCGMTRQQLEHLFEYKPLADQTLSSGSAGTKRCSHGFGLMNCKGIIDRYRKLSQIFSVCKLWAESEPGQGSRFCFRLPKGVARKALGMVVLLALGLSGRAAPTDAYQQNLLRMAGVYADSAYQSNIDGTYERTLLFADSCRGCLNRYYLSVHPRGKALMERVGSEQGIAPEIKWLHDSLPTNYNVILAMRNESAVAALALHQWEVYQYNNKVYTQLFKEASADATLAKYCQMMQRSETNKHVAIVFLLLLLLSIFPAYYFIYYRHRIDYLLNVDKLRQVMLVLLSDASAAEKLRAVKGLDARRLPAQLRSVVGQVHDALRQQVAQERMWGDRLRSVEEEHRAGELEDDRLHVSNSMLDNSLSTLKHETMYYPSRIGQLLGGGDANLHDIHELACYYKDLYRLLCHQTMEQAAMVPLAGRPVLLTEIVPPKVKAEAWEGKPAVEWERERVVGDPDLLRHLFDLLVKANGGAPLSVAATPRGKDYLVLRVAMSGVAWDEQGGGALFAPSMANLPYLLCRQIVRDIGELTNHRGCGIVAQRGEHITYLIITLTRWNTLK